jgi:hypothetical protein
VRPRARLPRNGLHHHLSPPPNEGPRGAAVVGAAGDRRVFVEVQTTLPLSWAARWCRGNALASMKLGTCVGSWRNGNDMRDEETRTSRHVELAEAVT